MKKGITLLAVLFCFFTSAFAQVDSLVIYYYENYPYAYTEKVADMSEKGQVKGIEIEIIDEYVKWVKQKKGINLKISYWLYTDFGKFYNSVKDARPSVLGLGSVTNNQEREKEVTFTPTYLHNSAVLITDGTVPMIKAKNAMEISKVLGNMSAIVVNKSSHVDYMNELKKSYLPNLKVGFTETQNNVLESIVTDKKVFGFSDIVAYWSFLKSNPSRFLKIQKSITQPKENLGFIMPKTNLHGAYLNEFFESGFGFTATKTYHQILERYLGYEIIEFVEVD